MNWNKITIHHSASRDVSLDTIRKWHLERGWSDIGYHFVIRESGKLEAGRPLTKVGAHVKGKNKGNIGICLTGNFEKAHPSQSQYSTLSTVLLVLIHAYQISLHQVFLHRDLASTLCPGKNFKKVEGKSWISSCR